MGDEANEEEVLLTKVPPDGSSIGNTSLMRALAWEEDRYWLVRNRLVDRGILETGRGKGGSVRRVVDSTLIVAPATENPERSASTSSQSEFGSESALYEPMAKVLDEHWVKDKRFESAIVRVTALQGRRHTGGIWTRPDITVAAFATYPYVPGRHFDVITFEVKPSSAVDVTSVYEALAHLRSATRAYVLFHLPDDSRASIEEQLREISAEAKQHGVGVIIAGDPADYDTWEELVEAKRNSPEPSRLNEFLAKQISAPDLKQIVKWFR